jgi:hypothetical protein
MAVEDFEKTENVSDFLAAQTAFTATSKSPLSVRMI